MDVKSYRFRQVQRKAKVDGKVVPTLEHLEILFSALIGMRCPVCQRTMNWTMKEGGSTCITLQHDRGGTIRLICKACNTRHSHYPDDTYFTMEPGKKWCLGCMQILPLEDFYVSNGGAQCKVCCNRRAKEWSRQNKDHVAAKKKERIARKIAAGHPNPYERSR